MNNPGLEQRLAVGSIEGSAQELGDRGFHNEPDDPNNPNEARESFEREILKEGKIPSEDSEDTARGKL